MSEERLPLSKHRFWFQLCIEPTSNILGPHFPGQDCERYTSCPALDVQMSSERASSSAITKDNAKGCYSIRSNPVESVPASPDKFVLTENFGVEKGSQLVHKLPRFYEDCPGGLSH